MPIGRIGSKDRVAYKLPRQHQRAVVVSRGVWEQRGPVMLHKISGEITPGMQNGILNDLDDVIVDEIKSDNGDIG